MPRKSIKLGARKIYLLMRMFRDLICSLRIIKTDNSRDERVFKEKTRSSPQSYKDKNIESSVNTAKRNS